MLQAPTINVAVEKANHRCNVARQNDMTATMSAFITQVENAGLSGPFRVGHIAGRKNNWQIAITVSCHIAKYCNPHAGVPTGWYFGILHSGMAGLTQKLQIILGTTRKQQFARVGIGALVAFALVNLGVLMVYREGTFPNTSVAGVRVGAVPFNELPAELDRQVLPEEIELGIKGKSEKLRTAELGISVDSGRIIAEIKASRSWLPVGNLLRQFTVPRYVQLDDTTFDKTFTTLSKKYKQASAEAIIVRKDAAFGLSGGTEGWQLEKNQVKQAILGTYANNSTKVEIPTIAVKPKTSRDDLQSKLALLQGQQKTVVTLTYAGRSVSLSPGDVVNWYVRQGSAFVLSEDKIRDAIAAVGQTFGIMVDNLTPGVSTVKTAVQSRKNVTFALKAAPLPTHSYTYCVAAKGVAGSNLSGFAAKLAAVYADSRGWGLKGQVVLTKVTSGCDFTAWLSAASQVPSFGGVCDSIWSCRIGNNVVINFDRWQHATTAWNNAGGSLDDYRSMVINHETGHWFEFGHSYCSGAGQPAPVMQQQSIDLQGCKFNPWPTATERANLKSALGL